MIDINNLRHHSLETHGVFAGKYRPNTFAFAVRATADHIASVINEALFLESIGKEVVYFNPKGSPEIERALHGKIKHFGRDNDLALINALSKPFNDDDYTSSLGRE